MILTTGYYGDVWDSGTQRARTPCPSAIETLWFLLSTISNARTIPG
jgi:hypothetical protein